MANAQQQRRVKTAREMAMPACVEPLHLTEENKEDIRRLVRKITPHFEAELWAKVNLHKAEEEEKRRQELEQLAEQKRQWAMAQQQQMVQPVYTGIAGNTVPYLGTMAGTAGGGGTSGLTLGVGAGHTTVNIYGGGGGGGSAGGSGMYTPVGTGFSTYGPLDTNQGLTISKP